MTFFGNSGGYYQLNAFSGSSHPCSSTSRLKAAVARRLVFSCISERVKRAALVSKLNKPKMTFDEHQASSALLLALLIMVIYTG